MIRLLLNLLLNRYTEREKLLLLEALGEAEAYLAKRHIHFNDAPHLLADLQKAICFTSSEHVHDVVARTLGIDTRAEQKPAASLDDGMNADEWRAFVDAELEKLSPAEIGEFWS